jgi:hypothetical protein
MQPLRKYQYFIFTAIVLLLFLNGCGPSAEQISTMTASAWTPTPPPTATPTSTPTATPVPYDLTVTVADETGAPIAGASIVFTESGDGTPKMANEQGQYSWNNLAGEMASLAISAQGYISATQSTTLQRGLNEVKVTLVRDPFGLLPSTSCAPGQKVLYLEDFQDGQSQGWLEISAGLDGMPNGWSIVDENGNKFLTHANAPSGGGSLLGDYTFDNFVWHLKFKVVGKDSEMFLMWRLTNPGPEAKRYIAFMNARQRPFMVRFSGGTAMNTAEASVIPNEDQWYNFDVAYFDGTHQVWMDGMKIMEYKDPQPYPAGMIGFETHLDQSKTTQFFLDDLVVCELTAPYEPSQ